MLPYWLGELERVVDGDGRTPGPVRADRPRTRSGSGPDRAGPGAAAAGAVRAASTPASRRGRTGCPTLTARSGAGSGLHPRLGEMPAGAHPGAVRDRPRRGARPPARGRSCAGRGGLSPRVHPLRHPDRDRARATCSAADSSGSPTCASDWAWLAVARPGGPGPAVRAARRPTVVGAAGPPLYVASTAAVLIAVLRNLRASRRWPLVALGAVSNLAAILANGGVMPASPDAVATAGLVDAAEASRTASSWRTRRSRP